MADSNAERQPIPLVDLGIQCRALEEELVSAITEVIRNTSFILGPAVAEFEEAFAKFLGAKHCIGVANGTEALHLSLRALGVGPGDEVITAANSFVASAFAIVHAGAKPVFVDVDPVYYHLDPELLDAAITPRTKAIIPVHLYGQPVDVDAIEAIAKKHGIPVVEDAAQAHGSEYHGRRVGTIGATGCFSFYPGKNLGALGDGGAIATNDDTLAETLRGMRNYGQRIKYHHDFLGFNSRLDSVQAAALSVKLPHLEDWSEKRRAAARVYDELLAEADLETPSERPHSRHVYHLYVIRHPKRDELLAHLHERKIFAGIHYPQPLNEIAAMGDSAVHPEGVPVTSQFAKEILSLPLFPEITRAQQETVVAAVLEFTGKR